MTTKSLAIEMEAKNLKVSVVIPTCHRNDLLAKCLDCLAPGGQTLPADQYEVIVTDDGSRSTAEQMVAEHYPWAKWTQGPRKGPASNRNHGARQARGNWIAFTDDDCLPDPNWLSSYVQALKLDCLVYEGKTIAKESIPGPFWTSPINTNGGLLWSCNMMVAKSVFDALEGFDEDFPSPHMEDVDFRIRVESRVGKARFIPGALVDHPPRRITSYRGQAKGHLSTVYFCKKHKLSLVSVGLTFPQLLRGLPRTFRNNLQFGFLSAFQYLVTYDLPRAILLTTQLKHYARLLR